MDPFTALGVAAAVVQFVEFGTKLGERMILMYDNNRMDPLQAFEKITGDLTQYVGQMDNHLAATRKRGLSETADSNVEAIEKLVAQCQEIAQDLWVKLDKIAEAVRARESKKNPLQTMVLVTAESAKAIWKQREIQETLDVLESYRSQIVLRMLLMLDIKADENAALGEEIRQKLSNVTEVLAVYQDRQRAATDNQADRLVARMDESDALSRRFYKDVTAAILTLRSGETKILQPPGAEAVDGSSGDYTQSMLHGGPRHMMQFKSAALSSVARADMRDLESIEKRILDSLYFRRMLDRLETVKKRHDETYEWVFCDPVEAQKPWDDFQHWLAEGSGCYWISGKAGSGKSTMMKFIYQDPRMTTLLHQWAQGYELKKSSFFFYGVGAEIHQKSQEGLLRALLHDMLSRNPEAIPLVMAELLSTVSHMGPEDRLEEPSLAELMRWFRRLLELGRDQHQRFFFLIDGIDEYHGDARTIVEFVSSVSENANVKFLLSSRPIPVCVENFSQFPKLQLHDLTRDDIRRYATDTLRQRWRKSDEDLNMVLDMLVDKSFGVFIWVELSVTSLIRGLENRDTTDELLKRLEELPSDLAKLYDHMLKNVSPLYRKQAAQLFRLTITSMQVQDTCPFTTLQVSFFEKDVVRNRTEKGHRRSSSQEQVLMPLSESEELARSDDTAGRIRSRCCGLIETRRATTHEKELMAHLKYEYPCVDFLHRTVLEFLADGRVWNGIVELSGEDFVPENTLFQSCSRLCAVLPTPRHSQIPNRLTWHVAASAMRYATLSERYEAPIPYLDLWHLHAILDRHWGSTQKLHVSHGLPKLKMSTHWASAFQLVYPDSDEAEYISSSVTPPNFGSIVIAHGLHSFVADAFKMDTTGLFNSETMKARHLHLATILFLSQLLPQNTTDDRVMELDLLKITETLLEHDADPNADLGTDPDGLEIPSPWLLVLQHAVAKRNLRDAAHDFANGGRTKTFARLVMAFISAGADVNASVVWRSKRYRDEAKPTVDKRSAMAVLDGFFRPRDKPSLMDGLVMVDSLQDVTSTDPQSDDGLLKVFHEQLMAVLRDRGAKTREWRNDVLVRGPAEGSEGGGEEGGGKAGKVKSRARLRDRMSRLFSK